MILVTELRLELTWGNFSPLFPKKRLNGDKKGSFCFSPLFPKKRLNGDKKGSFCFLYVGHFFFLINFFLYVPPLFIYVMCQYICMALTVVKIFVYEHLSWECDIFLTYHLPSFYIWWLIMRVYYLPFFYCSESRI
jgi:hypothetical protein